jgi:Fanconi anemia group M protein
VADDREASSGVIDALREIAVDVETRRLDAGDYALGTRVLVERKTVRGLHRSLIEGRLWSQIGRLRRASDFPLLFIEGPNIDDGPLSEGAVRGVCAAIIGQGIPIVFTSDARDTAAWLRVLVVRGGLNHFGSVGGVVSAGHDAWLEAPGIGPAAARELQRALT